MRERPRKRGMSVLVLLVAIGLLATGLIALPVGVLLLVVGEVKYGVEFLAYGIIASAIAMFGSDRSVLAATIGLYFPWRRSK